LIVSPLRFASFFLAPNFPFGNASPRHSPFTSRTQRVHETYVRIQPKSPLPTPPVASPRRPIDFTAENAEGAEPPARLLTALRVLRGEMLLPHDRQVAAVELRPRLLGPQPQRRAAVIAIEGWNRAGGPRAGRPGDRPRQRHWSLAGFPLFCSEKLPALGTKGDLILIDPRYYRIGDRSLTIAASEHVNFLKNQIVFRVTRRDDGQPWIEKPITLQDGATTVSPFVVLN
jgi:hypothetical protein